MNSVNGVKQRNTIWFGYNAAIAAFAAFFLVLLTGCAEKGPVLLTPSYSPTRPAVAVKKDSVVRVGPIRDSRGIGSSLVGKKTVSGQADDIMVQLALSDVVTKMLKQAFDARGFIVKSIMDPEVPRPGSLSLLAGGEIKTLWMESTSGPFLTTLHATIALKIMVGDAAEKKIIKTLDINSTIDRTMFYSREKLDKTLSNALSSALDQVFEDETIRKVLR
jgi:hypothetical protein